jgi:hypothetical protein
MKSVEHESAHIDADRSMAVYRGTIAQLVGDKIAIVNAIQGQGQSGGLIYHFATQRLVGLAKAVYGNFDEETKKYDEVLKNEGLAVRFEALFDKWGKDDLQRINKKVATAWDERMALAPKSLDAAQLQRILSQVPDMKRNLPKIARKGWPLPVQTALQDLRKPKRTQHYVQLDYQVFDVT